VRGRADDSGAARKLSIKSDLNEARKVMGYCPQFDGIQPNMTAREHLRFYAMIRGVPPASLEHTVDQLLTRMDLVQYADRQVCVCVCVCVYVCVCVVFSRRCGQG